MAKWLTTELPQVVFENSQTRVERNALCENYGGFWEEHRSPLSDNKSNLGIVT